MKRAGVFANASSFVAKVPMGSSTNSTSNRQTNFQNQNHRAASRLPFRPCVTSKKPRLCFANYPDNHPGKKKASKIIISKISVLRKINVTSVTE